MIEAAQKALAFAKAMGGNQVQLARDLPAREVVGNVVSLPHSGREAIVRSLAAAVDVRDGYTREHSRLVSELSAAIARRIGLPSSDVARISVGALLHDVGKIGVPDAILAKEGQPLPRRVGMHPRAPRAGQAHRRAGSRAHRRGAAWCSTIRSAGTAPATRQQLRGDDIPLGARIIAAADAYHAIRSDRPYRAGRTHREAMRELRRCSRRAVRPPRGGRPAGGPRHRRRTARAGGLRPGPHGPGPSRAARPSPTSRPQPSTRRACCDPLRRASDAGRSRPYRVGDEPEDVVADHRREDGQQDERSLQPAAKAAAAPDEPRRERARPRP